MGSPTMTVVRTAIRNTLIQDGLLLSLLGGPNVFHRYLRRRVQIPEITYFDYTNHPHPRMPLMETAVQVDIWDSLMDLAEVKAQRVVELLDTYQAEMLGLTPFSVPLGAVNWGALYLENERDDIAAEAPEIARKTLFFKFQAFDMAA